MNHRVTTSGLWDQRGFPEQDGFFSELETVLSLAIPEFKVGEGREMRQERKRAEDPAEPQQPLGGNVDVVQKESDESWVVSRQRTPGV